MCVCVRSHQKKNNRFTVCVQSHNVTCAYVISPLSLNQSVAMAVSNTILLDDFLCLRKF